MFWPWDFFGGGGQIFLNYKAKWTTNYHLRLETQCKTNFTLNFKILRSFAKLINLYPFSLVKFDNFVDAKMIFM